MKLTEFSVEKEVITSQDWIDSHLFKRCVMNTTTCLVEEYETLRRRRLVMEWKWEAFKIWHRNRGGQHFEYDYRGELYVRYDFNDRYCMHKSTLILGDYHHCSMCGRKLEKYISK